MLDTGHNPSASHDDACDLPPPFTQSRAILASRRCQRLRLRSRETTRARVRVGLIVALASLLLAMVVAQWSVRALHLDFSGLLKPVVVIVGITIAAYLLTVMVAVAIVRHRRNAAAQASEESAGRTA